MGLGSCFKSGNTEVKSAPKGGSNNNSNNSK